MGGYKAIPKYLSKFKDKELSYDDLEQMMNMIIAIEKILNIKSELDVVWNKYH